MMKKLMLLLAAVLIAALVLTSCGGQAESAQRHLEPLDRDAVRCVTALDAIYSSYMYVVEDEKALDELTQLYNGLTYEPLADGEEAPDLYLDKLYMLHFFGSGAEAGFGDAIASVNISPKGYVLIFDGQSESGTPYRLTSSFDEERLIALLTDYDIMKEPTFGE